MAHNKTLAAQLYAEFKEFFPHNAVEYFVSYYDYYQPEAYVPRHDLYIEKETEINEEIERLRLAATTALVSRKDVIIVASVSCIYGLGSPDEFLRGSVHLKVGEIYRRNALMRMLIDGQYQRNDLELRAGTFRVRGDTLEIINGISYINHQPQPHFQYMQYKYWVKTNGAALSNKLLDKLGIYYDNGERNMVSDSLYLLSLTHDEAEWLKTLPSIVSVTRKEDPRGAYDYRVFPHNNRYPWNEDNFGPLYIPKKGETIALSHENICLYERIIDVYEDNDLVVTDSLIYINGKPATRYTFKYNYYFMMGDNRHSSYDGRFWGFVPETHVIGRPKFIWLSLDKLKKFPANIRFKRMFKKV